jgi:hypothetical protein
MLHGKVLKYPGARARFNLMAGIQRSYRSIQDLLGGCFVALIVRLRPSSGYVVDLARNDASVHSLNAGDRPLATPRQSTSIPKTLARRAATCNY